MTPTHYYLDCGVALQTKNKLQAEFYSYLHSLNSKLIDSDKLPELKKQITDKLESLNTTYCRCAPIIIYFRENTVTGTIITQGFHAVSFYIKPAYYERN